MGVVVVVVAVVGGGGKEFKKGAEGSVRARMDISPSMGQMGVSAACVCVCKISTA